MFPYKASERWYSHRLRQEVSLARYGHFGQPLLLFPTAGGDAEECERFLMINALRPLIDAGRLKVYSTDSVAGQAWMNPMLSGVQRARIQTVFDEFICAEIVPAIRTDCHSLDIGILTAGASLGAFNALASLCRHPEIFTGAISMSGTYDFERWMKGQWSNDFYFSSPLHFLPNLSGPQLDTLRERFVLLTCGLGRWEAPEESRRVAHVLGSKGIPHQMDFWGPEWDHDWVTWRKMLPGSLDRILP